MQLRQKRESCAAIMIEEQDLSAVFVREKKDRSVKRKWTGNKAPDQLHNTVEEYTVSNKSRAEYETELET